MSNSEKPNGEDAELSNEVRERIAEVQTHVLYCPSCRSEKGRYDDIDAAQEQSYMHHIGTGHNPKILTGAYRK